MPFEMTIWSEVFNPDLTFRMVTPAGWTVMNRLPETPGALFNNVWTTSDPEYVGVNLSLVVYPVGVADQQVFYEKHLELYKSKPRMKVLDSGTLDGYPLPFNFVKVQSRESGFETIGIVAFYATDKYCYILQFVAPTNTYEKHKAFEKRYISGFEIASREGIPLPIRPPVGTEDGLGGWVAPAMPVEIDGVSTQTLVYVNEEFGFSFIVPADSSFSKMDGGAKWSILVNLPFKAGDIQAAFTFQVVEGAEITSALFLDQVERGLVEQRKGKRVKRVSFAGKYGGLEHLVMEFEHRQDRTTDSESRAVKVTSYVWVHTRSDRSFVLELMAPETVNVNMEEFSVYICNGFRVFDLPDASQRGEARTPAEGEML